MEISKIADIVKRKHENGKPWGLALYLVSQEFGVSVSSINKEFARRRMLAKVTKVNKQFEEQLTLL